MLAANVWLNPMIFDSTVEETLDGFLENRFQLLLTIQVSPVSNLLQQVI